jgi:hypothetical protein
LRLGWETDNVTLVREFHVPALNDH